MGPGVIVSKTTTAKSNRARAVSVGTDSVAQILERERDSLIHDWLTLVEEREDLTTIPLSYQDRTGHLPQLLCDVIARLHLDRSTKAPISVAASHHGDLRRKQGYSVAMVVEESRLLLVCLFTTLHEHTKQRDYVKLLPEVTIADEVDVVLGPNLLSPF
jgi:hypothetical protein